MLLQAQLREWEAAEAAKRAAEREAALRLKGDRAAQLADRNMVSCQQQAPVLLLGNTRWLCIASAVGGCTVGSPGGAGCFTFAVPRICFPVQPVCL